MRTIERLAILVVVGTIGAVATALLYMDTVNSESNLGRTSFEGDFKSQVFELQSFFASQQLLGLRAVGDALSSYGEIPSFAQFARIGRNYEVLFQAQFGGLAILQRIPNTAAYKTEWARNASVRYNRTITTTVFPMLADKDDEEVYIIADVVPDRRPQSDYIGFQVTVIDSIRLPLRALQYQWDNAVNYSTLWPVFGKPTTFTGLFEMPDFGTGEQVLSFMSITSIMDDDPTKHVVMTLSSPYSYLKTARTRPESTVATITDHFGVSVTYGDCEFSQTVYSLTETLPLTSSISWRFNVGQCPEYEAKFLTSKRYTVLAVCIVVTALALVTAAVVMLLQHRMVMQAVHQTRAEEKSHAQQLIVGYVCHELRNPLHVVLTSFRSVVSSLCHYTGNVAYKKEAIGESGNEEEELEGFEDTPSEEELLSIVRDAMASMHQMQTTVNEILDFRAITTGLSSLKINSVPVSLAKVVMPVLMRCRSFLASDVDFKVQMSDPDAVVFLDKNRLCQILINGMSNAGKFTSQPGQVVVRITVEQRKVSVVSPRSTGGTAHQRTLRDISKVYGPGVSSVVEVDESEVGISRGDVALDPCDPSTGTATYLVVTISNTREGPPMSRPEDCFIPFKQKGGKAGAWKTVDGSPAYIAKMRGMWLQSMVNPCSGQEPMALPALKSNRSGPVKATTGLGLPLCRGFAHASGGWLALDQSLGDNMTHFWGVLLSRPSSVHRTGEEAQAVAQAVDRLLDYTPRVPPEHGTASESFAMDASHLAAASEVLGGKEVKPREVNSSDEPGMVVTELSPGFGVRASSHTSNVAPLIGSEQLMSVSISSPMTASTPVWKEDKSTLASIPKAASHSSSRVHPVSEPSPHTNVEPVLPPIATSNDPDLRNFRVVVVDDEPANQRIAVRFLKSLGVAQRNITVLADGADALEYCRGNFLVTPDSMGVSRAESSPDVVAEPAQADLMFLDIRMPGKSGLDVMKELGQALPFPIIAMTGNVDKDSVDEYKSVGFSGCLGKPFEKRDMKQMITAVLNKQWISVVSRS